jgi:hypothetical protein
MYAASLRMPGRLRSSSGSGSAPPRNHPTGTCRPQYEGVVPAIAEHALVGDKVLAAAGCAGLQHVHRRTKPLVEPLGREILHVALEDVLEGDTVTRELALDGRGARFRPADSRE